jgi:small subunit ribosomal protein S5
MELAGIRDVLTKSLRSNNPFAVVRATFNALQQLRSPEQIARLRGKEVSHIYRVRTASES